MKIKHREFIYLACYVLFIIAMNVFAEIYNKPRALWLICPFVAAGIYVSIVMQKKAEMRVVVIKTLIILLFAAAAIANKKPQVLVYAALLCGAEQTSFKRICYVSFVTSLLVVLSAIILSSIGILPNRIFHHGGLEARALGFGYYGTVPYMSFFMTLEYLYLRTRKTGKTSWLELIVLFAVNYVAYKVSTVRLTFYLTCLTLGLYVILIRFGWFKLYRKWLVMLTTLVFPVAFAVTIWINAVFSYSKPWLVKLNSILTERLRLGHEALQRYPISLFGSEIITYNVTGPDYFYIDSGYLYSLLGYGLLFTALVLFMYIYMHRETAKTNDKMLFIWISVVAAFSLSNNTWISLQLNPVLLCFPIMLQEKRLVKSIRSILAKRKNGVYELLLEHWQQY